MREFAKCDFCGTWHQIDMVDWVGFPVKTCPYIPESLMTAYFREPSQDDNPISASYRGTA